MEIAADKISGIGSDCASQHGVIVGVLQNHRGNWLGDYEMGQLHVTDNQGLGSHAKSAQSWGKFLSREDTRQLFNQRRGSIKRDMTQLSGRQQLVGSAEPQERRYQDAGIGDDPHRVRLVRRYARTSCTISRNGKPRAVRCAAMDDSRDGSSFLMTSVRPSRITATLSAGLKRSFGSRSVRLGGTWMTFMAHDLHNYGRWKACHVSNGSSLPAGRLPVNAYQGGKMSAQSASWRDHGGVSHFPKREKCLTFRKAGKVPETFDAYKLRRVNQKQRTVC